MLYNEWLTSMAIEQKYLCTKYGLSKPTQKWSLSPVIYMTVNNLTLKSGVGNVENEVI